MMARLFCRTGELAGSSFEFTDTATIGRHPDNTIVLPVSSVAGRQASIHFDSQQGSFILKNLAGRSGLRLDGMEVTRKERLEDLHVITVGNQHDFIFQTMVEERPGSPAPEVEPAPATQERAPETVFGKAVKIPVPEFLTGRKPVPGEKPGTPPGGETLFAQPKKPRVPEFLRAGTDSGQPGPQPSDRDRQPSTMQLEVTLSSGPRLFTLREGEQTVGRSVDCDIALEDTSVSRRHAVLTLASGRVAVRDLGSVNATFLDQTKLTQETEIQPGCSLKFGGVRATLRIQQQPGDDSD